MQANKQRPPDHYFRNAWRIIVLQGIVVFLAGAALDTYAAAVIAVIFLVTNSVIFYLHER